MIDLQAKWVASVLSGNAILPSEEEMLADVEEHYRLMEENGIPKHHTHSLDLKMVYFGLSQLLISCWSRCKFLLLILYP